MRYIVIINNYTGKKNTSQYVRQALAQRNDQEILIFDTEYQGHEKELVSMMCNIFDDEPIRFIICGGSGTLSNALGGMKDFDKNEIAFYPSGISCDFLKCFTGTRKDFSKMDYLFAGKRIDLDYIRSDGGECAINTFSMGFDAKVVANLEFFRFLSMISGKMAYIFAVLRTLFQRRSVPVIVKIDGVEYHGGFTWIYVGNGICCGGRYYPLKEAKPNDGVLNIFLMREMSFLRAIGSMSAIKKGNIDQLGDKVVRLNGKRIKIKFETDQEEYFNHDGDIYKKRGIKLEVVPKGLHFIVPEDIQIIS